ncbi:hypothetical protein NQT69_04185 [Pseudoalteromonas shioyasakiensis]|uniref:hypothetical protein n=1 Tax=Pseudoalteromonas shioyasakiensis TaxID=1190813 RepID=UPI002118ECBE|nr:hypothetical protein [Pseudoalteromonas shioyasakiensis]MCQ8877239.1 hypothetical protein [Pseudoalteromonas shioyasakiensis]
MNKIIMTTLITLTFTAFSSVADLSSVPLPNDFKPTLQVANDYPLVQTGYSGQSIAEVNDFYLQALGKPDLTTGDNIRRTLFYTVDNTTVRISLFAHDYRTEIAIMITQF